VASQPAWWSIVQTDDYIGWQNQVSCITRPKRMHRLGTNINERRVRSWSRSLGSQPAGDSHKPGGRLPLLSARPAVTFPAREHHRPLAGTKLYCLVTEARVCVNNLPRVVTRQRCDRELNSRIRDTHSHYSNKKLKKYINFIRLLFNLETKLNQQPIIHTLVYQ